MKSKLWKNARSCNAEESFKKFLDPQLEADDLQNLISASLSTDTYVRSKILVVKFSWRSV